MYRVRRVQIGSSGEIAWESKRAEIMPWPVELTVGGLYALRSGRLYETMQAGFVPFAMLYRDESGERDTAWRRFQCEWCRPIIVGKKFNEYREEHYDG